MPRYLDATGSDESVTMLGNCLMSFRKLTPLNSVRVIPGARTLRFIILLSRQAMLSMIPD